MVNYVVQDAKEGSVTSFSVNSDKISVEPNNNSATYVSGSVYPKDTIMEAADKAGFIAEAAKINEESAEENLPISGEPIQEETNGEDAEDRSSYQETEDLRSVKPSYGKKKRTDKRVEQLLLEKQKIQEERDQYALALQEMSVTSLSQKKDKIESDIEQLTSVMKQSYEANDMDSFIKAQAAMVKLSSNKDKTEELLDGYYNEQQQQKNNREATNPKDIERQRREEAFERLSHPRELSSDYYYDWLDTKPSLDPFSYDFSPSLAQKFNEAKTNFNDYIHATQDVNYIGTVDYYNDLDNVYNDFIEKNYRKPIHGNMKTRQNNIPKNILEEEEDMLTGRPTNTPIVRQKNPYDTSSKLPELSEEEKYIAIMSPMTEAPSQFRNGPPPKALSNEQKIEIYRQNKYRTMER